MSGGAEFLIPIKLLLVLLKLLSGKARRALAPHTRRNRKRVFRGKIWVLLGHIAAIFRKYNLAHMPAPLFIVSEPHVRHVEPMHIMRRRISMEISVVIVIPFFSSTAKQI